MGLEGAEEEEESVQIKVGYLTLRSFLLVYTRQHFLRRDLSSPGLHQILVDIIHIQFKLLSVTQLSSSFLNKELPGDFLLMKFFIINYSKKIKNKK